MAVMNLCLKYGSCHLYRVFLFFFHLSFFSPTISFFCLLPLFQSRKFLLSHLSVTLSYLSFSSWPHLCSYFICLSLPGPSYSFIYLLLLSLPSHAWNRPVQECDIDQCQGRSWASVVRRLVPQDRRLPPPPPPTLSLLLWYHISIARHAIAASRPTLITHVSSRESNGKTTSKYHLIIKVF